MYIFLQFKFYLGVGGEEGAVVSRKLGHVCLNILFIYLSGCAKTLVAACRI